MYDVTSWFVDQTLGRSAAPKRVFSIGSSDYSERVDKWPSLKRTANDVRQVKISVPLANDDGALNHFYAQTYSMPNTCTLQIGYTHPDSGDELITVFTGHLLDVSYADRKCTVKARDRLYDFCERKVGDSDAPVEFAAQIPSDIAWTLCTCYGELSNVASTSNPDIDYVDFAAWAAVFSGDSVTCQARFEDEKVTEALSRLCAMNASAVWAGGDGRIKFRRFTEADSLDTVLTADEFTGLVIDVEGRRVVNRQHVYFDYAVSSEYWQSKVSDTASASVNSFGLHEDVIKDETVWFVDSGSALGIAQRRTAMLRYPPKSFDVETGLPGLHLELGETIRLVDSFYSIGSDSGWRFVEQQLNMDNGQQTFLLDEAAVATAFYLDVSLLDGDDLLL